MRDRLPLIISITALLVALLGATPLGRAAHATVVPRNSVGTVQLKRNAVTASKIAPNAIRTGQVVDGSLLSTDFKPGQIPPGPKGDKGDRGPKGDKGDPATGLWARVNGDGKLVGGQGVTGVSHVSTGTFDVTFDRDPSKCAVVGQPSLYLCGIGWDVEWWQGNTVRFHSYSTGGAFIDLPFSMAVFC